MITPEESLPIVCQGCSADLGAGFINKFCANCGYPVNESPVEQRKFVGRLQVLRLSLEEEWKKINRVRVFLFIISGIMVISGLVSVIPLDNTLAIAVTMVIFVILAGIFLTLGFLVRRYPLPVCIIGLVLYASIVLLDAFVDPKTIIQGIILKVFIVSSFIYGILAAQKVKQMAADLDQYTNIKLK